MNSPGKNEPPLAVWQIGLIVAGVILAGAFVVALIEIPTMKFDSSSAHVPTPLAADVPEPTGPPMSLRIAASRPAEPPASPAEPPAPPPVTYDDVRASRLVRVYFDNQLAGDREFKNQRLRVFGFIHEVTRAPNGLPVIVLAGDGYLRTVQCIFPRDMEGEIAKLHVDQYIAVEGICAGKDPFDVVMGCVNFERKSRPRN